jgi:hypothetical protein
MARRGRLRNFQNFHQIADAQFSVAQQIQNP